MLPGLFLCRPRDDDLKDIVRAAVEAHLSENLEKAEMCLLSEGQKVKDDGVRIDGKGSVGWGCGRCYT